MRARSKADKYTEGILKSAGIKYRPAIDGLRAIAVLSVIFYHAEITLNNVRLFKGGYLGVDVFFVISGFLITSLIITEYEKTSSFSLVGFYERRARRLLPALLVVILVSLPFAWAYLLPSQLIDFSKSTIASIFFGSNIYWHSSLQEYGAESSLLKPFVHTWSLAVEEQFYIIFPLLFLAAYKSFKSSLMILLAVCLLASLQFAEWMNKDYLSFAFYMLPTRFWEILSGALSAFVSLNYPREINNSFCCRTLSMVGILIIGYSVVFSGFGNDHPGYMTIFPVIGTALVVYFSDSLGVVTRVLSSRFLVGIGLISYSLYLWHYPVFAFGRIIEPSPDGCSKIVWLVLTVFFSLLTYAFLEKPFRNRRRVSIKTFLVVIVPMIFLIVAFSAVSIHKSGVRARFSDLIDIYDKNEFDNRILQVESWAPLNEMAKERGFGESKADKASVFEKEVLWFSGKPGATKVLIIGNSHGKDLFNALHQNADLFPNFEFARYAIEIGEDKQYYAQLFMSPNFKLADIIIISTRYSSSPRKKRGIAGSDIEVLPEVIRELKGRGKTVLVGSNTVEFENIQGQPVFDWYVKNRKNSFSIGELKYLFFENRDLRKAGSNDQILEICRRLGVPYLDKQDFICDLHKDTCEGITPDGYKSFYDQGHWTLEGAEYFGRRIHKLNWLGIGK